MIQAGIFNELKNDPTLAGLLTDGAGGFNIFPVRVPEPRLKSFDNFITYSRIAERKDTYCDYIVSTFQINAIAKSYDDVQSLADNIVRVLHGFMGNLGSKQLVERTFQLNQIDQWDDDAGLFFIPIDFRFIFKS